MKRLLACLALCASLSASAQGDNCTVLGIQDLTQMVFELQTQLNTQDATIDSLQNASMTRDSVRDLAAGVAFRGEFSNLNLAGVYWDVVIFASADFSYANLSGINVGDIWAPNSDFSGAVLQDAIIGGTLSGSDLSNTDLTFANLSYVNLSGASLEGANLTGANIEGANLTGANLTGATMTCLSGGCPSALPSGYTCEPDSDCSEPYRYRIVQN